MENDHGKVVYASLARVDDGGIKPDRNHGKDPLTRRLAEEIIASQTVEIGAMRQRLATLRDADDPNPGASPTIHGTRGTAPRE